MIVTSCTEYISNLDEEFNILSIESFNVCCRKGYKTLLSTSFDDQKLNREA